MEVGNPRFLCVEVSLRTRFSRGRGLLPLSRLSKADKEKHKDAEFSCGLGLCLSKAGKEKQKDAEFALCQPIVQM
jgi:Flp pilus assembly protein TadD